MSNPEVTMQDIYLARKKISRIARRTPLVHSPLLSEQIGSNIFLKLECVQETGAFKIRGAANRIINLTKEEKARGIITGSSGNHANGVAYVAGKLRIKAVICISERVPKNKVDTIRRLGAEIVVHGNTYDESVKHAFRLAEERGLTMIDSFDDPFVIAGQGTIGLELLEDFPEIDTVIVPLAGGGLLCGIALALKSANPAIQVTGVTMERAPVMYESLKAGRPIELEEEDTLAHALAGGLGDQNNYTFRMTQEYVDDVALVSEEAIADGMVFALDKHHLVVEGAGAVGIAALLEKRVQKIGRNVVVVISGGNEEIPMLCKIAKDRIA